MSKVLADSCYWIALINPEDNLHTRAMAINERIGFFDMLIPWPILYETLGTRTVNFYERVTTLQSWLRRKNISFIEDTDYRENALKILYNRADNHHKNLSLVDSILSEVLKENRFNITYFVSFDKDAIKVDFKTICSQKGITLIS